MSTDTMRWFALEINPEPWAIGPLDTGRRNGKIYPKVGPNLQLVSFQEAVRELLGAQEMLTGNIILRFFFWRQQAVYKMQNDKMKQRHEADATNMQKGLEDALQGVLFENDRKVDDVRSVVVEQGPDVKPLVIIGVDSHDRSMSDGVLELPQAVHDLLSRLDEHQQQLEFDLDFSAGSGAHPAADEDLF